MVKPTCENCGYYNSECCKDPSTVKKRKTIDGLGFEEYCVNYIPNWNLMMKRFQSIEKRLEKIEKLLAK